MFAHHMHAWCSKRPEGVVRPLELALETVLSLHLGAGDRACFLEEESVLLTPESLLWPPVFLCFSEIHACIYRCVTYLHFDMSTPVFCNKNYIF